ncbi:hypothetical protein AGMMS50289_04700 [Betaproteobacteria bacterium]|nr:hypothetical protein AGMMS50289_04700 [Betaproteobacteria bacterium]
MYSNEEIAALQKELAAKGVKYCVGAYVDIHGIPKGKVVPISHLRQMARGCATNSFATNPGNGRLITSP